MHRCVRIVLFAVGMLTLATAFVLGIGPMESSVHAQQGRPLPPEQMPNPFNNVPNGGLLWFVENQDVFLQEQAQLLPANDAGNQEDEKPDNDDEDDEPLALPERKPAEPIDPQLIQFELWDGSQISGKVQVESIAIDTSFGKLDVPISKIKRVLPGLNSYPGMREKIHGLVEKLADKDFDVRNEAQRELLNMGVLIKGLLPNLELEGTAEQKKRLSEISKEINAMAEDMADTLGGKRERSLIDKDTIETDEFAIVGTIQTQSYLLKTKFGDLQVSLGDIKAADRTVFGTADTILQTVKVDAEAFFQRKPVSARIHVARGDQIEIKAGGIVNWTNWNTSSTPDGITNQGSYQGITSGTLVARIGTSGKLIKIGSREKFTATEAGTLYLGIAIQDNYVNQRSYRWTGSYEAKIVVQPR